MLALIPLFVDCAYVQHSRLSVWDWIGVMPSDFSIEKLPTVITKTRKRHTVSKIYFIYGFSQNYIRKKNRFYIIFINIRADFVIFINILIYSRGGVNDNLFYFQNFYMLFDIHFHLPSG